MKTRIHRVVLAVKDLDKATALYSKLLDTTFHPVPMVEAFGIRLAFSYDPIIEVSQPIPGSDSPLAQAIADHIEKHGEGLYGVVFAADDASQIEAKVAELGIGVEQKLEFPKELLESEFMGKFNSFIEYHLKSEDTNGTKMALGQY